MQLPKPGQTIHLMGICGTAMASLAGLLKDRGYKITGSDSNPYPPMSTQLESLGIEIMKGYKPENLAHKPEFVIVGNVISKNNPEAEELLRLQIPYTSLPKALGEFVIEDRQSIVIAGTHGKTTTTSMMAWVAEKCGMNAGFLIGGVPKNFSQSFRNPKGDFFIIEGDEYDTAFFDKVPKFTHYKPRHVILTSIEFDHADIYANLDSVKAAFIKLFELIPEDGTLLYAGDDKNIVSLLSHAKVKKKISYGQHKCEYLAKIIRQDDQGIVFQVIHKSIFLGEFTIKMPGEYNVHNAAAVISMAVELDWDIELVREAIASFEGVKRRQEVIGEPRGITIVEDFAHHPTAVRETVKGIQKKYTGRKVFSIFEPRSATSRRKVFQKDYVDAFKQCHEVILAQAFDQTKIQEEDRFSSEELVADLKSGKVKADVFANADAIVNYLGREAKPNDVILIMSNGGFDNIYKKLIERLS